MRMDTLISPAQPVSDLKFIKPRAILLAMHQFVEDGEDLFAVAVHAAQIVSKTRFIAWRLKPLINQGFRNIYIAPKRVHRVTPQKQAIEHRRFALRSKRVEIFCSGNL